jgi:hypothetical protein
VAETREEEMEECFVKPLGTSVSDVIVESAFQNFYSGSVVKGDLALRLPGTTVRISLNGLLLFIVHLFL